ncbi:MAG: bifunctional adenosylcobinamide kinase/adenosylcobinamide-phosphate guanylyltransferase [bacterium]|nr:bifunctional adenosylcobinamide kinase/adenosylcobinamide-phosphate guanylyltransferase [bacterium]
MQSRKATAQITLVTGGSRSGKSAHALQLAGTQSQPTGGRGVFIATCPVIDPEMRDRVDRHQAERAGLGWETIEAETQIAEAVERVRAADPHRTLLIDSLSLWINNLMFHAAQQKRPALTEEDVTRLAGDLIAVCRATPGETVLVTDEVGSGIIPENPEARRFRDLLGRCNQTVAGLADAATLVCCGIPVVLKSPQDGSDGFG